MKKAVAIFVALGMVHGAGIAAPRGKKVQAKVPDLVEHRFDLKGCPFTLKDKPGYALLTHNANNVVYRVIDDRKTDRGISITFRCDEKPAQAFCPENTRVVDASESDQRFLKDLRIVRYERINDSYYGIASAQNLSAVPRPRPRDLTWCIGDDRRALWGESDIGDENREYTNRILKILRTIRFVEPESAQPSGSSNPASDSSNR